jgi:UDP-N-acetylmuramoylalanine--D-glutamate ligase
MFIHKKVLVVGAARSGISAAEALLEAGAQVTITDITPLAKMSPGDQEQLGRLGIPVVSGEHPLSLLDGVDLIVKNPGISPRIELLATAEARGIPRISELELASMLTDAEIVAITGTNGKTTTTALTGQLLSLGVRPVAVGGNIGLPLTKIAAGKGSDWILVVEASSFQLEDCYHLRPKVAVFTNISPDHLDRHGTMTNYVAAKARLARNMGPGEHVVLNYEDENLYNLDTGSAARVGFALSPVRGARAFIREGWFCWQNGRGEERVAPLTELTVPGRHNQQNALAALAAAKLMGLDNHLIAQGLKDFKGIEHRIEFAGQRTGIRFYNDSKATNPESTETALRAFSQQVILLAGGYDKGADFSGLAELFPEHVKHLVTFGVTGPKLSAAAREAGLTSVAESDTFDLAFAQAVTLAQAGDIVLLSPACASWDAFKDFEERGQVFKDLVKRLGG